MWRFLKHGFFLSPSMCGMEELQAHQPEGKYLLSSADIYD